MTPAYRISADDVDVTAAIASRFLSLSLNDEAGQESDSLEIKLDDADFTIAAPRKGVALACALGYQESGLVDFGIFVVDEVSTGGPPCSLTIRAKAANLGALETAGGLKSSLKSLKSRSWDQTTLGAIATAVASEHGYVAQIAEPLGSTPIAHVDQASESDIALLTRLAAQYDAVAKPVAGQLIFIPAATGKTASGETLPSVTIDRRGIVLELRRSRPRILPSRARLVAGSRRRQASKH